MIRLFVLATLLVAALTPAARTPFLRIGTFAGVRPSLGFYETALGKIKRHLYPEAEKDLRVALELSPDYTLARFSLGTLLLRDGKRFEARVTFASVARDSQDVALRVLATSMKDSIQP